MTVLYSDFKKLCEKTPYINKGIFYSELYLFLCCCWLNGVKVIYESGVKYGFSTMIMDQAFRGVIFSHDVDLSLLREFKWRRTTFIEGDSTELIPKALGENGFTRAAVLIDGPKGDKALALKDECLQYECCKVVGVHDVQPGHGESMHSYDYGFRKTHGEDLDSLIDTDYALKYPKGPGLALWSASGDVALKVRCT